MPHDKNGVLVEVGDEVLIRARVTAVWPGAETCNVQVETVEKMLPTYETGSVIMLNAHQVEKVATAEAATQESSAADVVDEQPAEAIANT